MVERKKILTYNHWGGGSSSNNSKKTFDFYIKWKFKPHFKS